MHNRNTLGPTPRKTSIKKVRAYSLLLQLYFNRFARDTISSYSKS